MKLYYHPFSGYSRRVRMQLIEKGIKVEEQLVDLTARGQKSEAYLALNPYGRVPTLVDGDFVLYESSAIMDYLEQLYPTPSLLPTTPQGRAHVSMHVKLCDLELGSQARALLFPRRFFPREKWDLAAQSAACTEVDKHLALVGRALGDREWLVGDALSLADLAYAIVSPFVELCELNPPANVAAWLARIEARPSAQATRSER